MSEPRVIRTFTADVIEYVAREVYRDESTSRTNLPEAWHTDIWPEAVTFTRRTPGVSDPTPVQAFKNMEMDAA